MVFSRKIFLLGAFVYLIFVVYGSLVPFDFRPRPLDQALKSFVSIRYLRLGMDSRADWVANIVLYVPLSFLWLGSLSREGHCFLRVVFSTFVFLFCVALSVVVEFTQQFFPPRTVSLNDIYAEILGTVIGIGIWWIAGEKLRRLLDVLFGQGKSAAYAGLVIYTVAYLALSLFPYDFLISGDEIRAKLSGQFFQWFPPRSACGGVLRCSAKLVAEAAAVAPLGFLIAVVWNKPGGSLIRSAAWVGAGLGLIIETLQLFLVSGITLVASVLTRAIGLGIGALAGEALKRTSLWPLLYLVRPFMPLAGGLYVLLLTCVTWMGKGPLLSLDAGMRRLNGIRFMPFYYHYYTSESAAMTSLFAVAVMFVPLGTLYWAWRITAMREFVARGAFNAALIGALIAAALELGKLFLGGARPDPTNVLIGSVAAVGGFVAASLCTKASLTLGLFEADTPDRNESRFGAQRF